MKLCNVIGRHRGSRNCQDAHKSRAKRRLSSKPPHSGENLRPHPGTEGRGSTPHPASGQMAEKEHRLHCAPARHQPSSSLITSTSLISFRSATTPPDFAQGTEIAYDIWPPRAPWHKGAIRVLSRFSPYTSRNSPSTVPSSGLPPGPCSPGGGSPPGGAPAC